MNQTYKRMLWTALIAGSVAAAGCGGEDDNGDVDAGDVGNDALDVAIDSSPDTTPDVTPDVVPDTTNMCAADETACGRSRDCADAGLTGFICTDGCCEAPAEICRDHLDPCTSADASTDAFICDTDTQVCLSRCAGDTANDTGSEDCPRGSWCLGINGEPPESDPSLTGVCLPGDCTSIFEDECGADMTCLAIGNDTSFCIPAGAGDEGDACNQAGGLSGDACNADADCPTGLSCSDGTCVQCGSDDECGGGETCSGGDCVPETDVCGAGLMCFQGVCNAPCDLDNGDADCTDEECVGVFDTTNDNRPGACGTGCTMFSSGECPEGEACSPTTGRTGLNDAVCEPLGDTIVGPGEDCSAADATCGEGYICLNQGTADAPDLSCSQWCDPAGGGTETFSNCGGEAGPGEEVIAPHSFGDASAYVALVAGSYDVQILDSADDSVVAPLTVDVVDGELETHVAAWDAADALDVLMFTDLAVDDVVPAQGIRGIHAAATAGNVDVYASTGWTDGVAVATTNGWGVAPAGSFNLWAWNDADVLAASAIDIAMVEGMAYTIATMGEAGSWTIGAYGIDATAAPAAGDSGVRFLHADSAAGAFDVWTDCNVAGLCTTNVVSNVAYLDNDVMATYEELAADTYTMAFYDQGVIPSAVTSPVFEVDVTLAADAGYTVVIHDDGGTTAVALLDEFGTAVAGEVDLEIVNFASTAASIVAENRAPIATDVAYGNAVEGADSAYWGLETGDYGLQLRATGTSADDAATYETGLFTVDADSYWTIVFTMVAGAMDTLFVSDDLTAPVAGSGHVRLIHAADGGPTVYVSTLPEGASTDVCFPLSIDGLGFCTEGCDPYPRMGTGNYGCETGNDCRPFVPGLSANWEDAQGICIDFAADTAAFAACETNFTFECEDFGLCLDLSFADVEAPVCMPLCEPFSQGQCPDNSVCSPIFPLLGSSDIATCDPNFVEAATGDTCVNTFPEGNPVPCSEDGTLCLGDGTGTSSCVVMCRAGFGDCPDGSSCQAPAFNDPIPSYMGLCQ